MDSRFRGLSPCLPESYGPSPEGFGPQGGRQAEGSRPQGGNDVILGGASKSFRFSGIYQPLG
jgi:hypothetical protein